MTGLPATFAAAIEPDAMAFAREFIQDHKREGGIFHPSAAALYGKDLMKHWAQQVHPFGVDEIVYFAENGSAEADLALRELIAEADNAGQPKGAVLSAYNIRLINPSRPSCRGGNHGKAANFIRDLGIILLLQRLNERFGLRANRSSATQGPSAASIAARALTEAGIISMGADGVEKVSRRYLPVFAGMPYARGTRFEFGFGLTPKRGLFQR